MQTLPLELEILLKEKFYSSRKELFTPEKIKQIRNNINIQYKERQELEKKFIKGFNIKISFK